MRLGKIQQQLISAQKKLSNYIESTNGFTHLNYPSAAIRFYSSLSQIGVLHNYAVQMLALLPDSHADKVALPPKAHELNQKIIVRTALVLDLLRELGVHADESAFYISVPENTDTLELSDLLKDLNTSFNQAFLGSSPISIKLDGFEKGSDWLKFVIESAMDVTHGTAIVYPFLYAAMHICKKVLEMDLIYAQYKSAKIDAATQEIISKANQTLMKTLVDDTVVKLVEDRQKLGIQTSHEDILRIALALNTLSNVFKAGSKVETEKLTFTTTEDEKIIQSLIEQTTKLITNK